MSDFSIITGIALFSVGVTWASYTFIVRPLFDVIKTERAYRVIGKFFLNVMNMNDMSREEFNRAMFEFAINGNRTESKRAFSVMQAMMECNRSSEYINGIAIHRAICELYAIILTMEPCYDIYYKKGGSKRYEKFNKRKHIDIIQLYEYVNKNIPHSNKARKIFKMKKWRRS